MKLESLRIHNMGVFCDFAVDFESLAGPLIAITGENGAGKTTALELALPGAAYRTTPTRGSLMDLARARDSLLEVQLTSGGKRWTIRHLLDGVSKKSEAVVLEEGKPVLDNTKVKSFDAWAERHLPPPEVLFATMFQAQKSEGFLAAKPAERKSLLLRILGIERLEGLATRARDHARETKASLDVCLARLADHRARVIPGARAEANAARVTADHSADIVDCTREEIGAAQSRVRELEQIRSTNAANLPLRQALVDAADGARARVRDLQTRIDNNRAVLADADEILAAQAKGEALGKELVTIDAAVTAARGEATNAGVVVAALSKQAADASAVSSRAGVRVAGLTERLRDATLIEEATASCPALQEALRAAADHRGVAQAALEAVRTTRLAGAEERIGGLRRALGRVIEEVDDGPEIASDALQADDGVAAAAAEFPQRLAKAQGDVDAAALAEVTAQRELQTAERLAARGPEIARVRVDIEAAKVERDEAQERWVELQRRANEKRVEEGEIVERAEQHAAEANRLRAELGALHSLIVRGAPLANAQARLDNELLPQLEAATAELERAESAVREVPPMLDEPPGNPAADLAAAEAAHAKAVKDHRELHDRIATLEARERQSREAEQQVAEIDVERLRLETELADWTRLAGDLGRDGLQALEIDAAGPELTALTNDLLHTCHGPRWTVRVETQRLASDGKRLLEGCDVIVLDTQNGREAQGETFSGGECVLIGEALSLALTMLACRRAGLRGITLVRDESGSALSPGNARAYVAMLRRAIEQVGAHQCLLVSHFPEVQELCDSRIEIKEARALAEAAE
jgi:DNA repair protein SbcC/Rad50